ncbi:Major facilitator superfamily domain [Phytophthora cactorum]|nr:Major facilitator superfamily domain [Phytophthora cactorum]
MAHSVPETPRFTSSKVSCVVSSGSDTVHQRLNALDARLSWFYLGGTRAELVLFTFTRRLVAHNVGMGTYALEAVGVGVFLGSALDARGRRSALLFAMTLSLVGLALSAMAKKDYHVIAARIVAGIGLGGELPAATVLVQELAPRSMRGRMVALLEAFTGVGGVVGVALAFGLAPQLGWRGTYLTICGCVLYAGVLRFGIPESPRWLASVGRVDEALCVVEKLERAHGTRERYDNLKVHDAVGSVLSVAQVKASAFDKPVQTLVLWTLWTVVVSSYALGVYVPTLISMSGFNMYERWNTIVLLTGHRFSAALELRTWSCVLAYTPENYTTAVRARGVAYAFGFSRLGASGGALLYPHMFDVWLMSVPAITWVFAGLLAATDGYSDEVASQDSDTDLELGADHEKEDSPLVVNVTEAPSPSWFYVCLLLFTGVSWAIQAAELVLLDFTRVLVANDIGMSTQVLGVFAASISMGSMAGGPIFGHIADQFGRRIAIMIAMVFSLGGLAVSARANAGNMLIIGRIVTGLGFGGQLGSTVVLVQELAPRSMSGRVVSLLDAFTGLIEHLHGIQAPGDDTQKLELEFMSAMESPSSIAAKPSLLMRLSPTLVLWMLWIAMSLSSYTLGIYVPTLISLSGYNVFANWSTIGVLYIAQTVGSIAAATGLDTYGFHRCFAVFATLATIFSVVLSYVTWSRAEVIAVTFVVTALLSACWGCVLAYTSRHYTTTHRGRGMGYAVGVSRLAAVGGSYLYPRMFNVWVLSVPVLCWIFGGV